ncbi:Hypothetical predicted protein [Paramuricea clavata]|uniref:Uncharacterized protein n=1 Tax=Paramuricea clavata TaxID=317549 RepID=A0A6S7HRY2_PARCT|nr:Hypothetical predicted protein [Paramuricea clavata]
MSTALLVYTPDVPLEDLHLADCEILPTKPFHDIGHHIENVFTELPHYLEDKERQVSEDCVKTCLDGKDRQAANAEEEERLFHHIKIIAKRTSNYSNDQVIPNIMVCLQAEKKMAQREDASKQDAHISTLSKALSPLRNTRIPISIIKRFERE